MMPWERDLEIRASDLVAAAVLAPSSHNTQPWIFRVTERGIEVRADRTRALPVTDPDDRELVISCGAALFNLRVAAAARRLRCDVSIRPEESIPDLLARVELGLGGGDEHPLCALAAAIGRRRTHRASFADREVEDPVVRKLVSAAGEEVDHVVRITDPARRAGIADLVAEGDAVQWSTPAWRRELAAWMRAPGAGDGLPVRAPVAPLARFIVRTFDLGGRMAARDRKLAERSPVLLVVGSDGDGTADWIRTGQGLQRALLVGTASGLQASYLNQPVQVPALRRRLAGVTGMPFPQVVLRLGYPTAELDAVPRRPVRDVGLPPGSV